MRNAFILSTVLLITSCGYGSYDECMKEEIKENYGKTSSYIENYCEEKFPPKPIKPIKPIGNISAKEKITSWLSKRKIGKKVINFKLIKSQLKLAAELRA